MVYYKKGKARVRKGSMAASGVVVDAGTIAHSYCRRAGSIITIDIEEVQIQYFRYIILLVVYLSIE